MRKQCPVIRPIQRVVGVAYATAVVSERKGLERPGWTIPHVTNELVSTEVLAYNAPLNFAVYGTAPAVGR